MSGLCDSVECLQKRVKEATLRSPKYKHVIEKMNEAADEGIFSVLFDDWLPEAVCEQLRNRGFKVDREDSKKTLVSYAYADEGRRRTPPSMPPHNMGFGEIPTIMPM